MPVLDFKEIPEANKAGDSDSFELFARDFLKFMGYHVVEDPDRGADGGRDTMVEEVRTGVGGESRVRWLVSCKHFAHGDNSVTPSKEANIRDRLEAHGCDGFLGFYSTIASTGLAKNLEGMKGKIEVQVFDHEKIEEAILHSSKGLQIAERYFPTSLAEWRDENPEPVLLFGAKPSLECKVCKKELLTQDDKGVITIWEVFRERESRSDPKHVRAVFWTCRGHCDRALASYMHDKHPELLDGWEDIVDVMMPTVYIKWVMGLLNQQHAGAKYDQEAFDATKNFLIQIFPYVTRKLTSDEQKRMDGLLMLPAFLGGFGRAES